MDTHTGGSNNIFRNNKLLYGGYYAETMRNPGPSGISVHSGGGGNVVEGNFIAFQMDVTGNDGGGIITDYTNHPTIVRNNVLYRNMGHGFVSTHSGKNIVVHNVFAENGYKSNKHKFGIAMSKKEDVDHIIANNIFYKNKSGGMTFNGLIDQQKFIDYNLFYQPKTPLVVDKFRESGTRFYDLASYRNATGFGKHSLNKDPLFLDPSNGDFQLHIDSPARDAATPLFSATTDKEGAVRPSGSGPDIGAYEE
jgi:parallel beta-helix repeat protein